MTRFYLFFLFLAANKLSAQIFIGPLTEGEFHNQVVYEGSYTSPGSCTWNDGIDFYMDFSGLTEIDGMEYVFVVDTPDPASTTLTNGWMSLNVGDSTVFNPSTTDLGISAASNAAQLYFHVRLIGTPVTSGQAYPCWIEGAVTEALCNNVWLLSVGESPIPCNVQSATSIIEQNLVPSLDVSINRITINSDEPGTLSIFSVSGKLIKETTLFAGTGQIELSDFSGIHLVRFQTDQHQITRKILLQK